MTIAFSIHESIQPNGTFELELESYTVNNSSDDHTLVRDKLRVPDAAGLVCRPRIDGLLKRSRAQFPATLIMGRAGTGKTAIAAAFASNCSDVSWFTVESNDVSWRSFSKYFAASLGRTISQTDGSSQNNIAAFLAELFCDETYTFAPGSLIVLDDIHHLFDTPWFEGFFTLLLCSLPASVHLLLLSRIRPPGPVWRMRSKQILNVLDEKDIAFDLPETQALFSSLGVAPEKAEPAQRASFGRVIKLIQPV